MIDGVHILQPTALAIKQAPSCCATVNIGSFPAALTIALRHIPQPEHLAKSCGRSNYATYHVYLVNNRLNTKTFLGPISKLRPGSFQLIAENIPEGTWDQLVVSLAHDDPSDLGLPLFTFSGNFNNLALPPERYTTLPADLHRTDQCASEEPLVHKTKRKLNFASRNIRSVAESDSELLKSGIESPEANKPSISMEQFVTSDDSTNDSGLLQPGIVLPEDEIFNGTPGAASPSQQKTAPMDGPAWFNPASEGNQSQQTLVPIAINELSYHALWLVNYQGIQLVGYVYNPSDPKKPTFIVHGVPGEHTRKSKPKEQGYDYWVANPAGKGGYWLRYVNAYDNRISYPFPVTDK